MATFRGHIAFGGATAALGSTLIALTVPTADFSLIASISAATVGGAFLPDIDSDTSVPFYIIFGGFTLAVSGISLYVAIKNTNELFKVVMIPIVVFLITWLIIGKLIKKLTHHRGIFHSVPAALLSSLTTIFVASKLLTTPDRAVLLGAAVGMGYLGHLLLDELYSFKTLDGLSFIPNRAFGTALKIWSTSFASSFSLYSLIVILGYATLPIILTASTILFQV